MQIGDVEYTRYIEGPVGAVIQESRNVDVSFAVGIKVRALLTRVGCFNVTAQAITGAQACFLENGQSIGATLTLGALLGDGRALPLHMTDYALSTNGMGISRPFETMWWKILQPEVRLHSVGTTLAATQFLYVLHYRFATLTDDEIVEIAAQRSTG